MNVERRRQIEELCQAARKQEPGRRNEFLSKVCGADGELRREIESLLNPDRLPDWRMDAASTIAASAEPDRTTIDRAPSPSTGEAAAVLARCLPTQIGRYKVLRLLGEGGMGVVYEAEQEHPRRVVALKVIKSGMTSPELLRRFELESLALGRLQHPGIAQIYEAGTAETSLGPQQYFAMEFVHGSSLLDYAVAQHLNMRQRLEVMAKICEAVHHAHQRGLIHRDLKVS